MSDQDPGPYDDKAAETFVAAVRKASPMITQPESVGAALLDSARSEIAKLNARIALLDGSCAAIAPETFIGWMAYTHDDCSDWSGPCVAPEHAIALWLDERLEDWREEMAEDGSDFKDAKPVEITVAKAVLPDHVLHGHALRILDNMADNAEAPEDMSDQWPPRNGVNLLAETRLERRVLLALRDYLEATTGERSTPWWTAEGSEVWAWDVRAGAYTPLKKETT